jgi:uncharacterized RDD family membrane protein YckC
VTPVNPWLRLVAKLVDFIFIGFVVGFVSALSKTPVFGVVSGYVLLLALDGQGASPGKRLAGLRVVNASTGAPCGVGESVLRNLVFLPELGRTLVNVLWGKEHVQAVALLSVAGLLVAVLEVRWMFTRRDGRRLGDAFGDTRVVRAR